MPRGNAKIKKQDLIPDEKYGSIVVEKLINYVMLDGKKIAAKKIVYAALDKSSEKLDAKPQDIVEQVIKNVGPIVEVKGKRIGGANYQVPVEVGRERKVVLALRWMLAATRAKKGKGAGEKLFEEICLAYNNDGAAVKKKEEVHRMAEANKAFAHFARF
ncbi:30S ribosomal protein S7 [Candidatus Berkelbacteria bacterium RIFOXYA2_FULL_43_10]|uniref:Small ribosomal subunit protein uS7 n=1 Tax=Candidatus Berkelbacteria bacterium RIFOXYA2_FULL_43_10 TaxID=1797472 RepID=A0A1F5E9S7_9BACT|nr:MAG: 30S ribosomal protein S7 [Candidatus Berkelbacteria bacterium RIFOXYA2_FULL_43_10]